jgi:hypothetical protein
MITSTEREKRMLLMGTGVPITAIWGGVSSGGEVGWDQVTYLAEPGRKWQDLVAAQCPGLARSSSECIETRANTKEEWDHHHADGACVTSSCCEKYLWRSMSVRAQSHWVWLSYVVVSQTPICRSQSYTNEIPTNLGGQIWASPWSRGEAEGIARTYIDEWERPLRREDSLDIGDAKALRFQVSFSRIVRVD